MFKTKFEAHYDHNEKYWVVIYRKWGERKWNILAANGDPYKFANEEAAEYMVKCLKESGL